MVHTELTRGRIALPVWGGTLVARHRFDPQQAAALAPLHALSGLVTGAASVFAATAAKMMTGAAIGPVLGGTLVKSFGFGSPAIVAAAIAAVAVSCFSRQPSAAPTAPRSALA